MSGFVLKTGCDNGRSLRHLEEAKHILQSGVGLVYSLSDGGQGLSGVLILLTLATPMMCIQSKGVGGVLTEC
jgi:hypothetical protein